MTTEEKIFIKSVTKWGLTSQMLMLAEEAGELSTTVLHCLRSKKVDAETHLAEEIADCQLMIDEIIFILHLEEQTQKVREIKLKRVEDYLRETK